jgi:hypothetical protein
MMLQKRRLALFLAAVQVNDSVPRFPVIFPKRTTANKKE